MALVVLAISSRACYEGADANDCLSHRMPVNEEETLLEMTEQFILEENRKRRNRDAVNKIEFDFSEESIDKYTEEYTDVADRVDHITQYLADLLVNTDNEITSLQANEEDFNQDQS